jgi:alpha-2-macroglobulin
MKPLCRFLVVLAVALGLRAAVPAGAQSIYVRTDGSAAFTPGSPVRLNLQVWSQVGDADVQVYRLSLNDAIELRRTTFYRLDTLLRDRKPLLEKHVAVERTGNDAARVDLGVLPIGIYAAVVRATWADPRRMVFSVTSLGVVTTETSAATTAFAVDLRTLHARRDVTFERYSGSDAKPAATVRADRSGLGWFRTRAVPGLDVFVARGSDGSVALFEGDLRTATHPAATEVGFLHTDRPIYRPGHRVMYRAVVRRGAPGSYEVPAGERTVQLHDPNGKVVFTAQRRLDRFGALSGEIPLAEAADLGTYTLETGDGAVSSQIEVQAYKKPEYVLDVSAPAATPGGEDVHVGVAARYFFGRPAAGMKLHYRARFNTAYRWWRRGSPFVFAGGWSPPSDADPKDVGGDAVAGDDGRAVITIPTSAVDVEKELTVEIDGRDESGATVTAEAQSQVTPGSFYLTVVPARWFVAAGEPVDVTVHSLGYVPATPRPGATVTVTFTRWRWNAATRKGEEQTASAQSVVTDGSGKASVHWTPAGSGYYQIRARASDERGREVAGTGSVWVSAAHYDRPYDFDGTTVVPQKDEYRPGERAKLLVTAATGDADALVHVVGGGEDRVFVHRLTSQTSTLEIDSPGRVGRYDVIVTVPTRHGPQIGSASVKIVPPPHKLQVDIRPEKATYQPGESARFAIRVRDADGSPVRAELGLAVVDDAIYALRRDATADPFAALYERPLPERAGAASWSAVDDPLVVTLYGRLKMIGGTSARSTALSAAQDAYSITAAASAPSFQQLRSDFRDTAYWAPAVVTNDDGRATVTFTWPDSLTSYTASGLAITRDSDAGNGTGSVLVTKDFLVRLAAPRFLRSGDAARLVATAQGTRSAAGALLRFSAPGLGIADQTTPVSFDRNASASTGWGVSAGELGETPLQLAGTSGNLSDGLRVMLPVESSGTAVHERSAGALPAQEPVALRPRPGAEAGDLRIDLAPSIVAQLLDDVRLLEVYPYSCVEQTMSAALPAIYVDRMRKRLNVPAGTGPSPADVARKAVARLRQLQHGDGSWGWWEHDPANPFMTAYALYGLAELQRDGNAVPADVLERGVRSLQYQLRDAGDTLAFWGGPQKGSQWNTRAFMLFALADADPSAVDRTLLASTDAQASSLNPYALATLGLAHLELRDRAGAQPLLDELKRRVTDESGFAHWKGNGWHYGWQDDPIETTAYALRFVHAMNADDPLVPRTVAWLRAQQHGSFYETTKDTAAAIYAMSETIAPASGELSPHETVRVLLDGRLVKTVRIDAPVLSAGEASVVIPGRALRAGGTLRFERTGSGALYWSTDWTQYVRDGGETAASPFAVERAYALSPAGEARIGDAVDVDLTVTAKTDVQYVAIEDPLPAGLQYQPNQYGAGDSWSGLQFFDDRVVFFTSALRAGVPLRLHYRLRATTAGTFTAPAPTAYAMYGPPTVAMGRSAKISIR